MLEAYTPDGMYCVKLASGATRWVSATELTSAEHTAEEFDASGSNPLPAGTFVAVVPEGGIKDKTRWLSGALVARPKDKSKRAPRHHVVLRKPRLQKPLTLKIAKRDGKFGIGLDDDNRVVDLKPG